jgi:hypothetical protein
MTGVASGSDAACAMAGCAVPSVACLAHSWSSLVAVAGDRAGCADGSLRAVSTDAGGSDWLQPQTIAQAKMASRATLVRRFETVDIGSPASVVQIDAALRSLRLACVSNVTGARDTIRRFIYRTTPA